VLVILIGFLISIPFWSDFNNDIVRQIRDYLQISIPFWSDFNSTHSTTCSSYTISIPFWSDFNFYPFSPVFSTFPLFQSHFGLILIVHAWKSSCKVLVFQSHFGLILITRRCKDTKWKLFQSHFGLILIKIAKPILLTCWYISIPFWSDFNIEVPVIHGNAIRFQSHFGLILI